MEVIVQAEFLFVPDPKVSSTPIIPRRVLVVDDSAAQRHVLSLSLARWGYRVTEADSGEAALKLCQEILKGFGERPAVAEAALRAGGLVQRCRHGPLPPCQDLRDQGARHRCGHQGHDGPRADGVSHELRRAQGRR
jgi:hypothetical protein